MLTHMSNIFFLTVLFAGKVHITSMTVLSVLLNRGTMNSKTGGGNYPISILPEANTLYT